jgi:sec-independent protein translocase protein TatB
MFDIGFWELALIGVVALLVVGPDRLPALARTVGLWVGRIRRYVSTVRDDIEREIQADELRSMLKKSDELNPLKDIIDETSGTIRDANMEIASVRKEADELLSADSDDARGATNSAAAGDETDAEPLTPGSAATTVAEAMSARSQIPAPTTDAAPGKTSGETSGETSVETSGEAPNESRSETAKDAKSDEHRSS